jgi:hypothetical protein
MEDTNALPWGNSLGRPDALLAIDVPHELLPVPHKNVGMKAVGTRVLRGSAAAVRDRLDVHPPLVSNIGVVRLKSEKLDDIRLCSHWLKLASRRNAELQPN